MKMIGNGLRLIRVFFRLVFEMIRNYKKLNNDPDHNFLICKEICQKIVESAKIQLEIVQKEALPKLENFLLVSNHLWHYPILSRYLDSIGCVALERGAKKPETIKNNIVSMHQALAKGNLVLFPEGECSYYDEQMHKFRKGGFIGLDAKQPIVPVYMKPERLSSIGRWIVPKGRVAVFIGSFFTPSEVEKGTPTAAKIADMARDEILALRQMSEG